jgi:outer membrane protein OmpA-like peptidoglycan-associated protein
MKTMKKIILVLAFLMLTMTSFGQQYEPYNKWAVGAEFGVSNISDESAISQEKLDNIFTHVGADVRYNFNPKIGVGIVGAYNNMDVEDFDGNPQNLDFGRVNLEVYLNIFKMLDLYPKKFTMLVHAGPGISFIDTNNDYSETVGNFSGGITGLYKVSNRFAIKLDYTSTGNVEQSRTLDGMFPTNTAGVTSNIHDLSLGLVVYFGKHKKDKLQPHADWMKPKVIIPLIDNRVTNEIIKKTYVTNVISKECECDCIVAEYVFFDHDKYIIKDSELNAIYKVYSVLQSDESLGLIINGWASPTSSTDEYNQKLSENRSKAIYQKYVDMGINPERIELDSFGKDFNKEIDNVHDVARRVELIVVKK